jgi:hypothetical protein
MTPETALAAFTRCLREVNQVRFEAIETNSAPMHELADRLAEMIGPRVALAAFCESAHRRLEERKR